MTEKQIFDGYKDALRMSSPAYKPVFLNWLRTLDPARYVRFCKFIGETPKGI